MTTTVRLHALMLARMYMNVKEDKMCVHDRLKRCMLNCYSSKTLACHVIIGKRRITVYLKNSMFLDDINNPSAILSYSFIIFY